MQTGFLQISCLKSEKKTILQEIYFEGALKITRPVYLSQNGEAFLYIMNPGGGFIAGDSYKIEVKLEKDAEVVLTTQSSAKIYKTVEQPAVQEVKIHLKKGSFLAYLPDPIIAFQHARYIQKTVVRMEAGSSFICTDIFTPGWASDGTLFRYDLLQSRLNIFLDGQLVLFDHLKLEPDEELAGIGLMEGYTHLGTMVVVDARVSQQLLNSLYELFQSFPASRIGLSKLTTPGFTLRVMSNSTQEVEKILNRSYEKIRELILHKQTSFLRKY